MCAGATACGTVAPADSSAPATQIPRDCEQLAEQVAEPEWRKGQNPKVLLAETTVALVEANDRIGATKACQGQQREGFGGLAK